MGTLSTLTAASKTIKSNPRQEDAVKALVKAHSALDEPHTGALWLRTAKKQVCILEVVPSMPQDEDADEPTEFLPSKGFPYPLLLLTGREEDFLAAIQRKPAFARLVANGIAVPHENEVTQKLMNAARKVMKMY